MFMYKMYLGEIIHVQRLVEEERYGICQVAIVSGFAGDEFWLTILKLNGIRTSWFSSEVTRWHPVYACPWAETTTRKTIEPTITK